MSKDISVKTPFLYSVGFYVSLIRNINHKHIQ